ncbi:hypothetical protein BHE74_00028039 [Ensete ventricosum]|nr:hypothetical protein BHE74_00028039 [Ensete ventricosum]
MDEDVTGSGGRLGKRPSESGIEVDYKTKVGTAWSHSYLNQKPWHPLSYPNQRRKWIAEQTHSNHAHRAEEVAREVAPIFCPSPDLCLQSFECFMTPRLARIDDPFLGVFPCSLLRSKSSFGRRLSSPRKRRRRLETGVPVRIKPFGVEIRNVRCVRCGTFGHQSGDRECPLKDVIMPNEESRLKRDDPLTAMMAQTDSSEASIVFLL